MKQPKEVKLKGTPVVQGWGAGVCQFMDSGKPVTVKQSIGVDDIGHEILRFKAIREKAKASYNKILEATTESEDRAILNIYLQLLDDPAFVGAVDEAVSGKLQNLESAIQAVSTDFVDRFEKMKSDFFRERASDIVEICDKLLATASEAEAETPSEEPFILVVRGVLTPSHVISRDTKQLKGIIADHAGPASHAVILARSHEIPLVTGIRGLVKHLSARSKVFLDGYNGEIFVNFTESTLARFKKLDDEAAGLEPLKSKWRGPVKTKDGVAVKVLANTAFPEDVEQALSCGADGIGLVRSEYIFFKHDRLPSLAEQQAYYTDLFHRAHGRRLVIRLLDAGGDKTPSYLKIPREFNPYMGWRGLRILLKKTGLFREHVTAILKAGTGHDFGIIAPMISNFHEWLDTRRFIESVADECGLPVPDCGVLFEVPLALLSIENFLDTIEFGSIGTNDFMQYLSAADRNNPRVNYLYNPVDPAVLVLLKKAIGLSNRAGKPISVCGEFAGFPLYTILLLGMGLREFSVNPKNIPLIKEVISHTTVKKAEGFARKLLKLVDPAHVQESLISMNKKVLPAKLRDYDIFYRPFK